MRSTETATNKEIDNVSQCNGTVRVFLLIFTIWLCLLETMQLDDPENYSAAVDPDGMTMPNVVMVGWRQFRNSIPQEVVDVVALRNPGQMWSSWTA